MRLHCELRGTKSLSERLLAIKRGAARRVVRKALRAAGKIQLSAVKPLTPVRSGRLKKSLKVRAMKRSRKGLGIMVQTAKGAFKGDEFYGGFLHWGTKRGKRPRLGDGRRSRRGQRRNPLDTRKAGIAANPWIKRGAQQSAAAAMKEFDRVAEIELAKELAKVSTP